MATLDTTRNAVAWGDVHVSMGEATTTGDMPTELDDLGEIDADGVSISTAEGDSYELKNINGVLLDKLTLEPTITLNVTLIGVNHEVMAKFWDTEESTSTPKVLSLKSFIKNKHFAFKLSNPQAIGSDVLEIPLAEASMTMEYAKDKGFTYPLTITILKGAKGFLNFSVVSES